MNYAMRSQLVVASTCLYTLEHSGHGPEEAMDVLRHLLPKSKSLLLLHGAQLQSV